MALDVSLPTAALAGLVSFLSPCVLPLVPPYLCYIAGTSVEDLTAHGGRGARRDVVLASLLFVAGFSTVFVTLGATASAFGALLRDFSGPLSVLAGVAILVMGLHFLGVFRLALLYREARVSVSRPASLPMAYVMGLAFAFGWTPCIGPILAAILTVAGSEETVGRGATLLAAYSLGLGLPFVAAGVAMPSFLAVFGRLRARMGLIERLAGAALVVTGIAFLTGGLQTASFWLIETLPALSRLG